jgi:hypothetical protein
MTPYGHTMVSVMVVVIKECWEESMSNGMFYTFEFLTYMETNYSDIL